MADALTAALNAGVSLDAIEKMLTVDGFSSEEIAKGVESLMARNAFKHDAVDVDDILAELRKIQPNTQIDWSDLALSRLFADIFRERCRYCSTAKEWFVFDGAIWKIDVGGMTVLQFAKTFVDALTLFCLGAPSERQKSDGLKFASRYAQLRYRENLIRDARDVNYFTSDELDRDGDLLNCRNGTLHLRTGAFTMHKPGDLLSKCCGAVYDPDARSEDFERFFTEIMCGDAEKARYLQKILGYSLTTDTSLETCWILYGATTRNGKSTLVETIAHTLGDYARTMQPQTLAQQKNRDTRQASGDIARLAGCRFLNASEPPKRMLFDTALLKTLLGRDTITARHLYEREFEFRPCFKLVINTNYLPVVTDDTEPDFADRPPADIRPAAGRRAGSLGAERPADSARDDVRPGTHRRAGAQGLLELRHPLPCGGGHDPRAQQRPAGADAGAAQLFAGDLRLPDGQGRVRPHRRQGKIAWKLKNKDSI